MAEVVRVSVSIEQALYDQLEGMVERAGYDNRSAFIRDLVRSRIVEEEWDAGQEVLATVHLVYDHHAYQLSTKLTRIQHDHSADVLATTHIHLSHHLCAEMIMVRGKANEIRALAGAMQKLKGVLHAAVAMTSLAGHHAG